jgi:hypothetical protein
VGPAARRKRGLSQRRSCATEGASGFEAYRAAERSLQDTIAILFGLSTEQPRSVTEADRAILEIEIRDLLKPVDGSRPAKASKTNRLAITHPWQPRVAKARFLSRFRELCWKL